MAAEPSLNAVIQKIVRDELDAVLAQRLEQTIGNRLDVVDRLVAALRGAPVARPDAAAPTGRRRGRPPGSGKGRGPGRPARAVKAKGASLPKAVSTAVGAKVRFKQGRGTFDGVVDKIDGKTGMATVRREGDGVEFLRKPEQLYAS